jgi:hypothetical protein
MSRHVLTILACVFAISVAAETPESQPVSDFNPPLAALSDQEVMSSLQIRLDQQDSVQQAAKELDNGEIAEQRADAIDAPLAAL